VIADLFHPEDLPVVHRRWQRFDRGEDTSNAIEYRLRHKDGHWRWFESVSTDLLADPDVRGIVVNVRDITDRNLAKDALRIGEERLRLALDALRIDRSFSKGLGADVENIAIVRAVATLAHDLGLTVTAEGIESEEQRRLAHALGCDRGQGYLFAPPMQAERIPELLAACRKVGLDGVGQLRPSIGAMAGRV
jgi:predicted signal transduction protein with EAL and GGDEF domain